MGKMSQKSEQEQEQSTDAEPKAQAASAKKHHVSHPSLALIQSAPADELAERCAEALTLYPRDERVIADFIHKHGGNRLMNEVHRKMGRAERANDVDIKMGHYSKDEDNYDKFKTGGTDVNRLVDPRLASHSHSRAMIATASKVYDNMGTATHDAPVGEVQVNTGAVSKILIEGKAVECVYGFRVGGSAMGWVPVSAFDDETKKTLIKRDRAIASRVEKAQKHAHFAAEAVTVTPVEAPEKFQGLRTLANQKDTNHENEAEHYFKRGDGAVNLVFNVPGSGGGRVGVASDRVGADSKFHKAKNVGPMHTPLFPDKSDKSDRALTFVYGKIVNSAGSEQYGWITEEQVSGPAAVPAPAAEEESEPGA